MNGFIVRYIPRMEHDLQGPYSSIRSLHRLRSKYRFASTIQPLRAEPFWHSLYKLAYLSICFLCLAPFLCTPEFNAHDWQQPNTPSPTQYLHSGQPSLHPAPTSPPQHTSQIYPVP